MWKIARNTRSESFITHLNENFGAGHLGQTVLPNTVSAITPYFSLKLFSFIRVVVPSFFFLILLTIIILVAKLQNGPQLGTI